MGKYVKLDSSNGINMSKELRESVEQELKIYAKAWYSKHYPQYIGDLRYLSIEVSNRLSTKTGVFRSKYEILPDGSRKRLYEDLAIQLNGKKLNLSILEGRKEEFYQKIFIHELIHFFLYMRGKPNGDGTPLFEKMIKEHNASSSGMVSNSYRGNKVMKTPTLKHRHTCSCEGKDWYLNRKEKRYLCTLCSKPIVYRDSGIYYP